MRVTPVPIPNTEVKPHTADGTAWETVWESRSLPALFVDARSSKDGRAFRLYLQALGAPEQPRLRPHGRQKSPRGQTSWRRCCRWRRTPFSDNDLRTDLE